MALIIWDKINIWTVRCKPKEAQSFIFFSISAHSLGDLILNYGSKYQKVLTTGKCMSPAQTSPLNSRLIYPTACLTSPLRRLIDIADFQVSNEIPELIHGPLPHLRNGNSILPVAQSSFSRLHLYLSRKSCWLLSSKYIHNLTTSHHLYHNSPGPSCHHQSPQ